MLSIWYKGPWHNSISLHGCLAQCQKVANQCIIPSQVSISIVFIFYLHLIPIWWIGMRLDNVSQSNLYVSFNKLPTAPILLGDTLTSPSFVYLCIVRQLGVTPCVLWTWSCTYLDNIWTRSGISLSCVYVAWPPYAPSPYASSAIYHPPVFAAKLMQSLNVAYALEIGYNLQLLPCCHQWSM